MSDRSVAAHGAARLFAVAAMAVALTSGTARAKDLPSIAPEKAGFSQEGLQRFDAKMHSYVDSGRAAGIVSLIARNGRIVHFDSYGYADIESKTPMAKDIHVRMFSMTKPITSVALLTLYEEGKFQLGDPLETYFPEFKGRKVFAGTDAKGTVKLEEPKRPPTVHDIFRHTAGFTYGNGNPPSPIDKLYAEAKPLEKDLQTMIGRLAPIPMAYQPGERWVYSVSHDVQAALVERLSGMKFDEFCRQRIFAPLGMTNTYFGIPPERAGHYATLYNYGEGKLTPIEKATGSTYGQYPGGGSSVSSNASDYLRFAQMLANGGELDGVRILSPETVHLMTQNHLPDGVWVNAPGQGVGYGLGVLSVVDPVAQGNLGSRGNFGWSGAANTHFFVDPEKNIVAIFITQSFPFDFRFGSELTTMTYQALGD